tara:strand:+ start:278 stop:382 length:105 start_codon:yes stop_codon:yes gene_type:complete
MNIEFQTIGELFCGLGGGGETGKRQDYFFRHLLA